MGQRWLFCPCARSSFEAGSGVPPLADTRQIDCEAEGVNTMMPSLLHEPPRPLEASQIVCGGPPAALIFFKLPATKNPISRLSGDQNGYMASSVPGKGVDARELSWRT